MRRMKQKTSIVDTRPKAAPLELSEAERALVARLIRLCRDRKYWLKYFVEWLLHMDSAKSELVTVKEVTAALEVMKNVVNWGDYFAEVCGKNPAFADFPGLEWGTSEADEDDGWGIGPTVEQSFGRKEQLESELREIKRQLISPRAMMFREAAAEYARRLGETLDAMKDEDDDEPEVA